MPEPEQPTFFCAAPSSGTGPSPGSGSPLVFDSHALYNPSPGVNVEFKDEKLTVTRTSDAKQNRSNHGTIRSRLANMVVGVTDGHKKDLEIQGIGFRAQLQGKKIVFSKLI